MELNTDTEAEPEGVPASGLLRGAPPVVGYNRVRSRSLGPLVEVPMDGMFTKDSSTRLSIKHLLFEPYLDH